MSNYFNQISQMMDKQLRSNHSEAGPAAAAAAAVGGGRVGTCPPKAP